MTTAEIVEMCAEAVHDQWVATKRAQGITSLPAEDGTEQIAPYATLPEHIKDLDRGSVIAVVEVLVARGLLEVDDPDWVAFEAHTMKEMLPQLLDSSINVSIVPGDVGDAKFWVELGASIMHDKPIVALVAPGRLVPEKLRRVADAVIEADLGTMEGVERVQEALIVTLERLGVQE